MNALRQFAIVASLALAAMASGQTIQRTRTTPDDLQFFGVNFEQIEFNFPQPVEARFWIKKDSITAVLPKMAPGTGYALSYVHVTSGTNTASRALRADPSDPESRRSTSVLGETPAGMRTLRYVPTSNAVPLDTDVELFEMRVELNPDLPRKGGRVDSNAPLTERMPELWHVMARFWKPGEKPASASRPEPAPAAAAEMSSAVATYRADAEHKETGRRCIDLLAQNGIEARLTGEIFPVIQVRPADHDRARKALAHAIQTADLHVRLVEEKLRANTLEIIAGYYDRDEKDGRRADEILHQHGIEADGIRNAGSGSINVAPERAAEARRLLAAAIEAEDLHVAITPAEEQIRSPGELFFVRHLTIPADQSPDSQETHRLVVVRNIEVQPLTFTSEVAWSFETKATSLNGVWSPDARHFLFSATGLGDGMKIYAVDLSATPPKEIDLGAAPAKVDVQQSEWLTPTRCRLPGQKNLIVDLGAAPPTLSIEQATAK